MTTSDISPEKKKIKRIIPKKLEKWLIFVGILLSIPLVFRTVHYFFYGNETNIGSLEKERPEFISRSGSDHFFPVPSGIHHQVRFWEKVFTKYGSNHVIFHDNRYLNVIFEVVETNSLHFSSRGNMRKWLVRKKTEYENILSRLSGRWNDFRNMTAAEKKIRSRYTQSRDVARFPQKRAYTRVRTQMGLSDSFKNGLVRSGRWISEMKRIFREKGLPEDLVCLPLIESSFNPRALSHAGAGGIWQFMPGTARHFGLKIQPGMDQRRDPYLSTEAAARLLKQYHSRLGNWPSAISAYNFGLGRMKTAAREFGSKDISFIIDNCDHPHFSFASRNFYPEFIAARKIMKNPSTFFPGIRRDAPWDVVHMRIGRNVLLSALRKYCQITPELIRKYNPAFGSEVYAKDGYIPKGSTLIIPKEYRRLFIAGYDAIPRESGSPRQLYSLRYRVKKGDSLSKIARRHHVSIESLVRYNALSDPDRIRVGTLLTIPE